MMPFLKRRLETLNAYLTVNDIKLVKAKWEPKSRIKPKHEPKGVIYVRPLKKEESESPMSVRKPKKTGERVSQDSNESFAPSTAPQVISVNDLKTSEIEVKGKLFHGQKTPVKTKTKWEKDLYKKKEYVYISCDPKKLKENAKNLKKFD